MSNQFGLSSLYRQDYELWLESTINQLRQHDFDNLDIDLLIEEIEEMGGSLKDALENNLIVILAHLLKWKYQPGHRSGSWRGSIKEHRRRINKSIQKHPSLSRYYETIFEECYPPALDWAVEETGLSQDIFPPQCPFTRQQVIDSQFLPD
ncbi:DUF29 domain-containing protein [Cylindrospermum sp. FACHB-282]|uniref:DUF29 domain-containing protein n=1 Tax=Cylindrospermum sp. FACHB-282 TaxID=2692794 RepID=UPI001687B1F4|nr:DUF29 domain-containing protein [Cylindrospermum sp. FACHB-282]MBD2384206.1 DUF29 domain-containing protein [Cylindrospermum sp. FACHB-282]